MDFTQKVSRLTKSGKPYQNIAKEANHLPLSRRIPAIGYPGGYLQTQKG